MGDYSVPESIRKLKPKGTMVKNISGYYYVYEYSNYTDSNGKRHTSMGKSIGKIKKGIGYVPKDTFLCDSEILTLEFGDYAIAMANSAKTLGLLKEFFNPEDAITIYAVALIHAVQEFVYLTDIKDYYDMSILSIKYPTLKMGYDVLSKLYENLGCRQTNVLELEQRLIDECSKQIAIDGHVIACESNNNDLAEKGYKFQKIGESQINLLMAYDVNTNIPLLSRIYEGASTDKVSVKDFLNQVELKDMLFIIDRGFYSVENIELFSSNGNQYIIPLGRNLTSCKLAIQNLALNERFIYKKGKKSSIIEYKDEIIENHRVITYRDLNESLTEQESYLNHIEKGDQSYTKEKFSKIKDLMGVIVLQTNIDDKTPEEIYTLYKKRWSIETFYNYFKNGADFNSLHQTSYYKTQGLAFIMLITALIHHELSEKVKNIKGKSVDKCLLEAKMVKANKRFGQWTVCNCLKKQVDLFEALDTPLKI